MRKFHQIPAVMAIMTLLGGLGLPATAQPAVPASGSGALVRATLRSDSALVQAGAPVWADFTLTNLTPDPVALQVLEADCANDGPSAMGLPLEHVFSSTGFAALTVKNDHGEVFDTQVHHRPQGPVPVVTLSPYGSVGVRVELTRYYPSLQRPGTFELVWRPYHGDIESAPLKLTILAEKQAIISTDYGRITMRFYYREAPRHVQNFIELVERGFYDGLKFHRVVPGGIVQGGDPRGDGRGIRADGKRLKAEFSSVPFAPGTVGMARGKSPDSASCQFYICLGRQPDFDGNQTAFAYLVGEESFETLRLIAAVPTGPRDRPRKPVYIRAISLENVPMREREVGPSATGKVASRPAAGRTNGRQPVQQAGGRGKSATGGGQGSSSGTPATQPSSPPHVQR